jgi:hypothetical protein
VPIQTAFDRWVEYQKWNEIFKKESAQAAENPDRDSGEDDSGEEDAGEEDSGDDDEESDGRGEVKVTAKIGPSRREWTAEIIECDVPHRLGWSSRGGLQARGVTSFHSLADRLTKVMVEIEYKPSGFLETVGNFFRMQRRRVRRDLRLFKNYVELHELVHPDDDSDNQGDDSHRDDRRKGR